MQGKIVPCAAVIVLVGVGCSDGSRDAADGVMGDPIAETDGGNTPAPSTNADAAAPGTSSDAASPPVNGADGAMPGIVDQVTEYLTCKPDELNPVIDCLTVTCPMQGDPIALATCLTEDCTKLVEKVSPKCRDCVVAGIAQDTQGLIEDCLDTSTILGDAGTGTLPF